MRTSVLLVVTLSLLATSVLADEEESSDRLDDFSDISMDDNESESAADLSHLSDDEFLAGDGDAGGGHRLGEQPASKAAADKSALMLRVMREALKRPGMTQRFGQILPILRVMSPPQRLALVSLVMQQAMVPVDVQDPPLEMAMRLGATPDGSSNLTSQLLLPLSADIAHIFRGAGLQAGLQAGQEGAAPPQGRSAGGHPYRPPQVQQAPQGPQMPLWRGPGPHAPAAMPPPLLGPRPPPLSGAAPAPEGSQTQRPQRRTPPQAQGHGGPAGPAGPAGTPAANRRNAHVPPSTDMMPPPAPGRHAPTTLRPFGPPAAPTTAVGLLADHHGCSLFSDTVCASVDHYPEDAILASIQADKHTVDALLADKTPTSFTPAQGRSVPVEAQRRQDDDYSSDSPQSLDGHDGPEDPQLCPSVIKYARPQRARATSGQWKYIVNTAEHTQTLRLEKCSRLEEPCQYMSDKVRSHCTQVYNYHRLLTWDKELGLHMDIFKAEESRPVRDSGRDTLSPSRAPSASRPTWPFRRAATRRPPVQQAQQGGQGGQGHGPQYGLQTLEESPAPGDHLPAYPPLHHEYDYPPQAGRRTGSVRNRTRGAAPRPQHDDVLDDLTAEGTQRRPVPVILSPEGNAVRVPAPAPGPGPTPAATSKRPPPPVLPPRLETYRPRPTTSPPRPTTTTTTTPAPIIVPSSTAATATASAPTKRVNYSYHPIIDFFRPLEKQMSAQEPRHGHARPAAAAALTAPAPSPSPSGPQRKDVAEQRTAPDDTPLPAPGWSAQAQQGDWNPITRTPESS
ncbi:Neurotrophin 1 [Frankliniella fusca]|uniref:Neurotrophin 1 n=1 Tax=Frankliniella fusca TaxID=407009 RepID=A0AAE1LQ31_9NEOP|nr:Neurotrophin 1 [Frankliniella fusca]